jgi:hypothetical protein
MLLEFPKINLAVKDNGGWTPLYLACFYGNVEVAELLLKTEKGVKTLEIPHDQGQNWTPLLVACSEGELGIVKLLLSPEYGAKTDVKDINGQTPLHLASLARRYGSDIVPILLSAQKSLLEKVDAKSQTALHVATDVSSLSVVQALIKAHANLDNVNSDGRTALHLAVQELGDSGSDGRAIMRELIEAKAQVDIADFDGHTALQYAGRGQEEVYTEAIKLISGALDQGKRKEALLEIFANEDQPARDRLLKSLKWDDFQEAEIELIRHEAKLIEIAVPSPGDMQADAFKASQSEVREELNAKCEASKPYYFPHGFDHKPLSALPLAAYFGYHRLAYVLLLYSVSEWNEIKQDRDDALTIAKCVLGQVLEELKKVKSLKKSSRVVIEAKERRKKDFKDVIDVLNDPPAGDYDLVRGWSEVDDLNQKPKLDDGTIRAFSETIDATIVDFHRVEDPKGGTRVDFLRRTRSVWDVVYVEPPSPKPSEGDLKSKSGPQEGDLKSKAGDKERRVLDKKKSKIAPAPAPAPPTKPSKEVTNCGPVNIMKVARKKTGQARSGVKGKTGKFYTEENLQFRWLHLSANNVSGHKYVAILKCLN